MHKKRWSTGERPLIAVVILCSTCGYCAKGRGYTHEMAEKAAQYALTHHGCKKHKRAKV